jgi:cytochrome c-type biogenesis protein CcmF
LFLVAVGPLLPWRRASWPQLRKRLVVPAVAGAAVIVALAAAGLTNVAAASALGLAAFVATSNASEMVRGVRAHANATGRRLPAATVGVLARNRRLYGGLVAHLGLAMAAAAITVSSSFAHQTEVTLVRGQATQFVGYTLTYQGEHTLHQPQREVLIADVSVTRDGESLGELTPSVNLYPGTTDPIGTPSIHYGVLNDLYASLVGFDRVGGASRASFRFFLNPGVLWLWVGGGIMALGGLLAAWPERRRRHWVASVPEVERAAPRVPEAVS